MYRTSYSGHHTCTIIDSINPSTESYTSIFDSVTLTSHPPLLTAKENSRFYEDSFNYSVISHVSTANSKNYSGEQVQYPDPMAHSYNYREEEECREEDSVIGPIGNRDPEMGKDLRLCYPPSHPSISSHLAGTVTNSIPNSQSSCPSQTSSPSVDFNDVFCFRP
ncbi:hypothetical protein M5689_014816 [Euphorbia peplus]|nr:hypothetical protein M5689_014816 [Euphorbia peplus]